MLLKDLNGFQGLSLLVDDTSSRQQQQQACGAELLEAAARFCAAAADLQLLGVWKASKRRRIASVTRTFAPDGPGLLLRQHVEEADGQGLAVCGGGEEDCGGGGNVGV